MFRLRIVSPSGVLLDKEVVSLTAKSEGKGQFELLSGHTDFIATLEKTSVVRVNLANETKYYAVFGGAIWMQQGEAKILGQEVEDGYNIDVARAIASRDRALDRINNPRGETDIIRAKASLARALTRISASNKTMGDNQ